MATLTINTQNIMLMDGGAAQDIIDEQVAVAVADFVKYGDDCKGRKINIEIEIKKDKDTGRNFVMVGAQAKVPAKWSNPMRFKAKTERSGHIRGLFDDIQSEEDEAPKHDSRDEAGDDDGEPAAVPMGAAARSKANGE